MFEAKTEGNNNLTRRSLQFWKRYRKLVILLFTLIAMAESQSAIQKAQSVSLAKTTATSGDTDELSITRYRSMTELPIAAPKNLADSGEAKRIFWSIQWINNLDPFEFFLERSRAIKY